MSATLGPFFNLFKLRIGFAIALTALAGLAITPGSSPEPWQVVVLGLAVLLSSASAGGLNQYMERDLDARMPRTRGRPFVTGALSHGRHWLVVLYTMLAVSVIMAVLAFDDLSVALYVFLGAFFYAAVYTAWLKRRTWLNIVIGGLAGSFAVLAGAAAVDPSLGPLPVILAVVLFLWTPSHFWSLAIALREEYAAAGVPMLPVVVGARRAARIVFGNTLLLVTVSLLPVFYGMGAIYLAGAVVGGLLFIRANLRLVRDPSPGRAMASFHASLAQLTLLLCAVMLDALWT